MSELTIHMFPCLADNYGYLLHDAESGATAAVDTPDARRDRAAARREGLAADPYPEHPSPRGSRGRQSRAQAANGLHDRRSARRCRAYSRHRRRSGRGRRRRARERIVPTVYDTPGHTRGHIVYHFAASARRVRRRHVVRLGLRPLVRRHAGADVELAAEDPAVGRTTRGSTARTSTRRAMRVSR